MKNFLIGSVVLFLMIILAKPITGSFKLMALLQRTYRIEVFSANPAYNDTTITNVIVVAQQNKNLGTINLSSR